MNTLNNKYLPLGINEDGAKHFKNVSNMARMDNI